MVYAERRAWKVLRADIASADSSSISTPKSPSPEDLGFLVSHAAIHGEIRFLK